MGGSSISRDTQLKYWNYTLRYTRTQKCGELPPPLLLVLGCYFVLPILGPTTARDAIGLVGNVFLDPVYQVTHNTEIDNGVVGNANYSEHNYYYYRGTGAVDFRAKNIESWDSLEKNSIDLYASLKSLYLQNRKQKILNSKSTIETQDDSDWEEIDSN